MKTLSLNRVHIAYEDVGTGRPVVLLHGFPLNHAMWQPQIEFLSRSYRVIAPDLRGFGGSSLAKGDEQRGVEMHTYAEDVVALLDALEITEPVVLGGFSMGGYILWQFARRYPERVRALVACDTRVLADTEEGSAGRLKLAEQVMQVGIEPVVTAMLPKLLSPETHENNPNVVIQVSLMMRSCGPAAVAAALRGMARRPDMTAELPRITHPILVLVGSTDAISSPAEMRGFAENLAQHEFVEIPSAGHLVTLENPSAVNDAFVGFLERTR
jgi:pimeloyl-ACP methyl ester carboxylesterase